ncbi:MAG TPA: hypothetical protein ENN14_01790, partial [Chloroflexi bacterium]|nr:hypothetical protein [Chloroflexota bacterium]
MTGNVWVVLPLAWVGGGAFLLGLIGRLWRRARNPILAALTALIFGGGLLLQLPVFAEVNGALLGNGGLPRWGTAAPGGIVLEATPSALLLSTLALGMGLCAALYSGGYMARDPRYPVYYPLLLLMVAGLQGMLLTTDLFNLYLFCELMSVAAYALVAFRRHTDTAIEAGFKYLILGSVGTLVMLFGIACIYREMGELALPLAAFAHGIWGRVGTASILVGLGLKSGIVPLHTWLPDAYGRAPSSVSALLASVVSKSTLIVLLQVCLGLGMPASDLGLLLILFAFLNMT